MHFVYDYLEISSESANTNVWNLSHGGKKKVVHEPWQFSILLVTFSITLISVSMDGLNIYKSFSSVIWKGMNNFFSLLKYL